MLRRIARWIVIGIATFIATVLCYGSAAGGINSLP